MTDDVTDDISPLYSTAEQIDQLRESFDQGITRPVDWRRDQLGALLGLLRTHADELIDALADDMGKPRVEAHFTDIGFTASDIAHTRSHLEKWTRPRRAKLRLQDRPGRGHVIAEPLGVSLVIAPWNYPVQLSLAPLATALAAGNTVALKPSELVPTTSALLARLLRQTLDPAAVRVFEGGPEVATELLEQRFDHIFFTGSTTVGRVVAQAAARHLTPTILELGGKSPVIVADDANIDIAARRIAWGKGVNAGQTCIAPDYVLVAERLKEELVAGMTAAFERYYGADPLRSPDLASIVNERHFDRVRGLLDGHGGEVACGGTVDENTRKVAPTIVVEPNPDRPMMHEELFAPILPVVGVPDLDVAIDAVNARPKPLALYVFGGDDNVERVVGATSSGGVCVNQVMMHIGPPDLPFGGVGDAGHGRYHGRAGFDALSNLKPVYQRPLRPDFSFIYPPYTKLKAKLLTR